MRRGADAREIRRFAVALATTLLLVPATTAAAKDPPKGRSKGTEVVTPFGKRLHEAIVAATKNEFWGTVLVARKGQIELAKGYGFADYDAKPNAPDTLFELASASKQVTATAILRLEQQKKLYAPALENYACGWRVEKTARGTTKASHGGSVAGYHIEIARWLEEDVLVIVLTNDKHDPFAPEKAVEPLLF